MPSAQDADADRWRWLAKMMMKGPAMFGPARASMGMGMGLRVGLLAFGCWLTGGTDLLRSSEPAAERAAGSNTAAGDKVLRHAVFFKFKESSAEADVARLVDAFAELPSQIVEIEDYEAGVDIGHSRFGSGLTHCFLVTFRDEAGRAAYLPHPAHEAFVAELHPHLEKVFVIDYWGRPSTFRPEKQLRHAVFLKFNEDASDADVRAVEDGLADLPAKIAAIKSFEWGKNNSPEPHDHGFTHCFMFSFDSLAELNEYLAHPAHVAEAEQLARWVEDIRVLDFWVGPK